MRECVYARVHVHARQLDGNLRTLADDVTGFVPGCLALHDRIFKIASRTIIPNSKLSTERKEKKLEFDARVSPAKTDTARIAPFSRSLIQEFREEACECGTACVIAWCCRAFFLTAYLPAALPRLSKRYG